jgi:hypothetical protein
VPTYRLIMTSDYLSVKALGISIAILILIYPLDQNHHQKLNTCGNLAILLLFSGVNYHLFSYDIHEMYGNAVILFFREVNYC